MFCSNCGSKLGESAKFCDVCGKQIETAAKVNEISKWENTEDGSAPQEMMKVEAGNITGSITEFTHVNIPKDIAGKKKSNGKIYNILIAISAIALMLFFLPIGREGDFLYEILEQGNFSVFGTLSFIFTMITFLAVAVRLPSRKTALVFTLPLDVLAVVVAILQLTLDVENLVYRSIGTYAVLGFALLRSILAFLVYVKMEKVAVKSSKKLKLRFVQKLVLLIAVTCFFLPCMMVSCDSEPNKETGFQIMTDHFDDNGTGTVVSIAIFALIVISLLSLIIRRKLTSVMPFYLGTTAFVLLAMTKLVFNEYIDSYLFGFFLIIGMVFLEIALNLITGIRMSGTGPVSVLPSEQKKKSNLITCITDIIIIIYIIVIIVLLATGTLKEKEYDSASTTGEAVATDAVESDMGEDIYEDASNLLIDRLYDIYAENDYYSMYTIENVTLADQSEGTWEDGSVGNILLKVTADAIHPSDEPSNYKVYIFASCQVEEDNDINLWDYVLYMESELVSAPLTLYTNGFRTDNSMGNLTFGLNPPEGFYDASFTIDLWDSLLEDDGIE